MVHHNTDTGFKYTYSAKEQDEIKRIRQKYLSREEDSMTRLRKLDASATSKATVIALVFGIVGALILGTGMSLIMTKISEFLGLGGSMAMVVGIVIGIAGGILASLAYPIYNAIVKAKRKKLAPEIIRLTDELIK